MISLDLSKIESGKLEMQNDHVKIADILHDMEMLFTEVARNKKIKYNITTGKDLPKSIFTDKVRVEQVIKKPAFQCILNSRLKTETIDINCRGRR